MRPPSSPLVGALVQWVCQQRKQVGRLGRAVGVVVVAAVGGVEVGVGVGVGVGAATPGMILMMMTTATATETAEATEEDQRRPLPRAAVVVRVWRRGGERRVRGEPS